MVNLTIVSVLRQLDTPNEKSKLFIYSLFSECEYPALDMEFIFRTAAFKFTVNISSYL
jgi:hypothetical protein